MSAYRRGFKTEANGHAIALRRELKLKDHDPLCPWRVAKHLDIPVIPLTALEQFAPSSVRFLTGRGSKYFSAVTIFVGRYGRRRVIFHNDGHAKTRQTANVAHELAHAILSHNPTPPFAPEQIAEEEAKWMGPALLISDSAALHIVTSGMQSDVAAKHYGVSNSLLEMRLNVSGARIRVLRRQGKR